MTLTEIETGPAPSASKTGARRPWFRPPGRRIAVAALLAATALLYCWNLSVNGYGNEFYAAAAQAGGQDWTAWLFGSLDPNHVITVDKPPAALWVTGLSVRIFGLSSWSVLLPQALMGVATVGLVYLTTRRLLVSSVPARVATGGALLAGAGCALTPAAVLIFRFNNPDALLVLLMTAAAYAVVRACQGGSWRWLAACGALLGFAFLTKMLQGLLVLPGFGLAYLVFARVGWWRRARDLAIGVIAVVVSAGWFVLLTMLWPAASRPYIGGSEDGSFMNLVLGYNGFARIFGGDGPGGGSGGGPGGGGPGGMTAATGTSFGGTPSWQRLFSNEFGNEVSWLLPAALLVLVVGLVLIARKRLHRDAALGLTVFGSWLLVTGLIFSYMSGTVHPYYTVALVPAIAVLVGGGAALAWHARGTRGGTTTLITLVLAGGGWGIVRAWRAGFGQPALGIATGVLMAAAIVVLILTRRRSGRPAAAAALAALLAIGLATGSFAVATAGTAHTGGVPTAVRTTNASGMFGGMGGPGGGGAPGDRGVASVDRSGTSERSGMPGAGGGAGMPGGQTDTALVDLLEDTTTEWAAAAEGAMSQGSLQLASGRPVIALGGFTGSDPAPTLAQFQQWVREGRIAYYIGGHQGGPGGGGGAGGPQRSSAIADWVKANFTATTVGGQTVYRLTAS